MTERLSDEHILLAYAEWSEEIFCAGFYGPSERSVHDFRLWHRQRQERPREDYETEMLVKFHRQEAEEQTDGE